MSKLHNKVKNTYSCLKWCVGMLLVLYTAMVNAQAPLVFDTAPLQTVKTVILPTYDNLVKLQMATVDQRIVAMKAYGYEKTGSSDDSFAAIGSTVYYVSWSAALVSIFFTEKTPYTQALEKDIKKRFPEALRTTSAEKIEYHIKVTNPAGQLTVATITIDHGNDDGDGGSATLFKED